MKNINFNDITPNERYETIKGFLHEVRNSKSSPNSGKIGQRYCLLPTGHENASGDPPGRCALTKKIQVYTKSLKFQCLW